MHQQTLTQLFPPASAPASVPPSPVASVATMPPPPASGQSSQDLLPPGWVSIVDANSGNPVWIYPASNRVVFNRLDMYKKPAATPAPAAAAPVPTTSPDMVPSSPLAAFFGRGKVTPPGGKNKSTPIDLLSSSSDEEESDDDNGFEDLDSISTTSKSATYDAAHTMAGLQLRQESDEDAKAKAD